MVLLKSLKLPLNSNAIPFSLKGIDNNIYTLENFTNKPLVIIFTCNHCPYAIALWQRIINLNNKYNEINFVAINPNIHPKYPEDSFENMIIFAKTNNITFPYLVDDTQETAKLYKAQCTPDIYLYDKNHKLKYHGRIDDNWQNENLVKTHDLNDAIINLINGKEINPVQHPSIGCSIKWR